MRVIDEFRILSPTAILGYGFPAESFAAGLSKCPHAIAVDAGSTDPGPYYLGAGVSFTSRRAVKRDLDRIIPAALERGVPVLIGTAGGSGADIHLRWNLEIIREIAAERRLGFKIATVGAEIAKTEVSRLWRAGRISPLPPGPELTEEDIVQSVRIVGQMGMEPLLQALDAGADVVLAGRCYDPAVFAAPAVRHGFPAGLAVHLGKILECAAIAATPGSGADCLFGWLRRDRFEVEPLNSARACTVSSVAAHTLYEKSNPYLLPGPGGVLDLRAARFEQVDSRRVRVSGSRYEPSRPYRIKLEGARSLGFRTLSIAGIRDPVMIERIDEVIAGVRARVAESLGNDGSSFRLEFRLYGKNGVMGPLEPEQAAGHELGLIIEAIAGTQELADFVCSQARSTMLHHGYAGRISTAGNLAFPYSPSDLKAGEVFTFSLYHLAEVEDPCAFFPMELWRVEGGEMGRI